MVAIGISLVGGCPAMIGSCAYIGYRAHLTSLDERESQLAKSQRLIRGTVQEERYSNVLVPILEKPLDGFQSEIPQTLNLESKYAIEIVGDDGLVYGISVLDAPNKQKELLEIVLKEGSRVSFLAGNIYEESTNIPLRTLKEETYFTQENRFGNKRADRIFVE